MLYSAKSLTRVIGLISIVVIGMPAAKASDFSQAVSRFDLGVQTSILSAKDFYLKANDMQRDAYFDELAIDPSKEMGLTENGKSTPMISKFSDQEINARILALNLIANYSKALLQLSDPSKAKTAESELRTTGKQIEDIGRKLGSIAQAAPVVGAIAAPAAELAGLANKLWTRVKQEAALKQTIREGAPRITKLIKLLEEDSYIFYEGVYKNSSQRSLGKFINYYNREMVLKASPEPEAVNASRLEFLRSVKISAERYALISDLNPKSSLTSMRKVHDDLLLWASAPKNSPFDIKLLSNDVNAFLDDLDTVTNAAQKLRFAH